MHVLKFYLCLEICSRQTLRRALRKTGCVPLLSIVLLRLYLKIKRPHYADEARLMKY